MEPHFDGHHYPHHWQPPAPYPPHPPHPPAFFPPPPPHHQLPPPLPPQPPHQPPPPPYQPPPPHQHPYYGHPDHFIDHGNGHHFPNPNPDAYPSINGNYMAGNEPVDSFGGFCSNNRKRGRHFSDTKGDVFHAKLYVAPVPSTATEEDIRPLFEEHGCVVEIVFPRDKRTGHRQGYIFMKYATTEEADGAIRALNGQYTFPGEKAPVTVKYADKEKEHLASLERERFGNSDREHAGGGEVVDKIFVGAINKQASKEEIAEICSAYGTVKDVYIVRNLQKQARGYAFVKYSHRDMAVAAIKALNGIFTMRGCNEPLIVRFAEPKKQTTGGELRGNHAFGGQNFGPCSHEHMVRPVPGFGNGVGGCTLPNPPYPMQQIPMHSQPQAPHTVRPALGAPPMMEQTLPLSKQEAAQSCLIAPEETQASKNFLVSSQQAMSDTTKQAQSLDQQQSAPVSMESSLTGNSTPAVDVNSAATAASSSPQAADPQECDWSEHACPDGYKYYYNCVTCESRWEKPDELKKFQQQLLKKQKVHSPSQQLHPPSTGFSSEEVEQIKKEVDQVKTESESRAIVDPVC